MTLENLRKISVLFTEWTKGATMKDATFLQNINKTVGQHTYVLRFKVEEESNLILVQEN
jgi:hypothetical protein